MYNTEDQRRDIWRRMFPAALCILLSLFELVLTITILSCEIVGSFIHFPRMNAFVGYWTFPIFMCAWISLSSASCCCRTSCCGAAALAFQILAMPMALCVIGFDAYFINNPTQCFFTNCTKSSWSSSTYGLSDYNSLYEIKVPLVKGQLAAGVLMLVSCIIYIIIYAVTKYRTGKLMSQQSGHPVKVINQPYNYQNNATHFHEGAEFQSSSNLPVKTNDHNTAETLVNPTVPKNELICPNCRSRFKVAL